MMGQDKEIEELASILFFIRNESCRWIEVHEDNKWQYRDEARKLLNILSKSPNNGKEERQQSCSNDSGGQINVPQMHIEPTPTQGKEEKCEHRFDIIKAKKCIICGKYESYDPINQEPTPTVKVKENYNSRTTQELYCRIINFLDEYPIKSPLCFSKEHHECEDLAEELAVTLPQGAFNIELFKDKIAPLLDYNEVMIEAVCSQIPQSKGE